MCSDDTIYWIFCALVTQETTIITKKEHHLRERSSMNFMWQQTPFGTISFTLNKKLQYCPGNIFIFSSIWKQQKKRFKYIHSTYTLFWFWHFHLLKTSLRYNDRLAPWTSKPTIYKKYLFLFLMDEKPHTAVQQTYVPRNLYGFWKLI